MSTSGFAWKVHACAAIEKSPPERKGRESWEACRAMKSLVASVPGVLRLRVAARPNNGTSVPGIAAVPIWECWRFECQVLFFQWYAEIQRDFGAFRQVHRLGWHEGATNESRAEGARETGARRRLRRCQCRRLRRPDRCWRAIFRRGSLCAAACEPGFPIFEFRNACGIEGHIRQRVGVAIQFAAHVLDGKILQLAAELGRAFVQRF